MGCRSDHMEPQQREIEGSKVLTLIDELQNKGFSKRHFSGYHPEAYSQGLTQKELDELTEKLCSLMQLVTTNRLQTMSLEAQTWWRDHQEADKRHAEEDEAIRKASTFKVYVPYKNIDFTEGRGPMLPMGKAFISFEEAARYIDFRTGIYGSTGRAWSVDKDSGHYTIREVEVFADGNAERVKEGVTPYPDVSDEERKAEALKIARSKLTPEELILLGLDD